MRESRTYGFGRGACDDARPYRYRGAKGGIAMKLLRLSLRATPSSTCLKTACLLLPAIVLAVGVRAQPANYPHKAVRIISDAAPGGAIDTNLRIIAESLSQKWAQQVVIENRPGAGGSISATAAAEAPPDGYTMYAPALSVFLTIPGKAPNLPLKLPRDFTPIGITAVQPQSIGINPKLSINSLPELIAQAKKEPGSISYAVTGVGRLTHLTGELLQIRANIQLQMVPYTGALHRPSQTSPLAAFRWLSKATRDWPGPMSQANSKRWQSPRKSVCLTFPMCRPLRKRCLVLSPSAGNAW